MQTGRLSLQQHPGRVLLVLCILLVLVSAYVETARRSRPPIPPVPSTRFHAADDLPLSEPSFLSQPQSIRDANLFDSPGLGRWITTHTPSPEPEVLLSPLLQRLVESEAPPPPPVEPPEPEPEPVPEPVRTLDVRYSGFVRRLDGRMQVFLTFPETGEYRILAPDADWHGYTFESITRNELHLKRKRESTILRLPLNEVISLEIP